MNLSGLIIFLMFWNFTYAEMHPALFYDWEDRQLMEISEYDGEEIYKSCISACPVASNSPEENIINDNVSIKRNGIFLRQVYGEHIASEEIKIEICESSFTPTLAWNYDTLAYDVGYQLYYEEGKIEPKASKYYSYIQKGDKSGSQGAESSSENPVKIIEKGENVEFEIVADEPEKKWKFYWITVLSVHISKDSMHRFVEFHADKPNTNNASVDFCEKYLLGDDRGIVNEDDSTKEKKSIKLFSGRLVKAQIIPMDMFYTWPARLATCVFSNFAFIWESIENGMLEKIDSFVLGIRAEKIPGMNFFFGVNGQLTESNELDSEHYLFRMFSIPSKIFRFIDFSGVDGQNYGVAIIIHNDLEPIKDADRICSTKDEVPGWDDVKNKFSEIGFSYTCPRTEEVMMKLGFDEKASAGDIKPLHLNHIPVQNDTTKQIYYVNYLENVRVRLGITKK